MSQEYSELLIFCYQSQLNRERFHPCSPNVQDIHVQQKTAVGRTNRERTG